MESVEWHNLGSIIPCHSAHHFCYDTIPVDVDSRRSKCTIAEAHERWHLVSGELDQEPSPKTTIAPVAPSGQSVVMAVILKSLGQSGGSQKLP